ncbi:Lipid A export ATP-binding/permease protein MsbA [Sporomusa ovata DSM 2662]|uniref:Lipid A export ATP-binding/permease protein MsbA n=1 Tax=Sporomusa ovata TaxID=2378 RepID=A0A0U1KTP4_9FIRM|nr:ABC transporter ATP-binding protein [Sporomusa ovata]EQB26187.1 subtilin transport ATP-binding protein SpaT [Sporomusa ovata DSM 2662]CQR70263.1 Lipid A export ATP-binding/permease protein MsbA [Sporomusa ovata]
MRISIKPKVQNYCHNYAFVFHMLWQYCRKYFILLSLASIAISMLPIGSMYLEREIINIIVYSAKQESDFIIAIIILALIGGFNTLLTFSIELQRLFGNFCSKLVSRQLTYLVLRKSTDLDMAFYDTDEYYKKLEHVKQAFGSGWESFIRDPMSIFSESIGLITLIGILASFNIWLVPIIVFGVSPNLIFQLKTRKKEIQFMYSRTPETRKMNYVETVLTDRQFAKEVKLFGFSEKIIQMARDVFGDYFKKMKDMQLSVVKLHTFGGAFSNFALFVVSAVITYHAFQGKITIGDWQLYISTIFSIRTSLAEIYGTIANTYKQDLYAVILTDFLETKPTIELNKGVEFPTKGTPPAIEFRDVSFAYPCTAKSILSNISFTIKPGEKIALVGLNGSGKSTLIKLLTRLYDPVSGSILFNGVDIKQYKPSDIYGLFGTVFQDFSKYAFTLSDNISISNVIKCDNKSAIQKAAVASGASKLADELPNGFDTFLTKSFDLNGVSDLSGGNWQKIAIARAFFRESPIVILDEPTSALDPEAEYNIYHKFVELCRQNTAIIISHRLSSVRMADRIFLLQDSQITESGTHHELMELNGEYARLFNLQADSYKISETL